MQFESSVKSVVMVLKYGNGKKQKKWKKYRTSGCWWVEKKTPKYILIIKKKSKSRQKAKKNTHKKATKVCKSQNYRKVF